MNQEHIKEKYLEIMQLIEDKEFVQAEEKLRDLLYEKPEFAPAYNKLGVVKARTGDIETAQEYFEKAIDYWPNFSAPYSNLGNIYVEQNDDETAEYYYNQALKINDQNRIPYNNLARIYKQRRQIGAFIKYQQLSHKYRGIDGDQEVFKYFFNEDVPDKFKQGGMPGCFSFTKTMLVTLIVIIVILILL